VTGGSTNSNSSGGSTTVVINGHPQFLPVIDWNDLVIDEHNPLLGKVGPYYTDLGPCLGPYLGPYLASTTPCSAR